MTREPDDRLDAELRRLFDDDRLDVTPRPEAGQEIVAGARRVRRRRTMATSGASALAAVGLVFGGVALQQSLGSGAGTEVAAPPSTRVGTTERPPLPSPTIIPGHGQPVPGQTGRAAPPASPTGQQTSRQQVPPPASSTGMPNSVPMLASVLAPSGYGQLRLGMSFDQARATGMLAASGSQAPEPGSCGRYRLTEGSAAIKQVVVSGDPAHGVVRIRSAGARTPEGIGAGSSKTELEGAYPGIQRTSATYSVSTGAGSTYVFYVDDDKVTEVQLVSSDPGC